MTTSGRHISRKELQQLLHDLRHPLLKASAVQALHSLDRAWVVGILHAYLHGRSRNIRELAIRAIIQLDPSLSVDWLLPLLEQPHEPLRWFICFVLVAMLECPIALVGREAQAALDLDPVASLE